MGGYAFPPTEVSIPSSSGRSSNGGNLFRGYVQKVSIPSSSGRSSNPGVRLLASDSSAVSIPSSSGRSSNDELKLFLAQAKSQSLLLQVGLLTNRGQAGPHARSVSIPSSSGRSSNGSPGCGPQGGAWSQSLLLQVGLLTLKCCVRMEDTPSQSLLLQVGLLTAGAFKTPSALECLNPFFFRSVF